MKVRHMATAIRHDAGFIVRNGRRMLAHTFRGSTWRSAVGLESMRDAFRRYRGIRQRERDYLDWPDPLNGVSLSTGRGLSTTPAAAFDHATMGELSTPALPL